ncbi:NTP transferase domain-containing protein [Candidatus Woesearchaeota archaeon]|nr:NTP transferase domain-containing protein [Candidatus Woesearchaeota archaeon]
MDYKVCILAAGMGTRMKHFTRTFNKAIIPIQGKPSICHIIEKFPEQIEIVIAVGYKKETIIDYLNVQYQHRKFIFVDIDHFEGEGSGPGYSLLQCKEYLQCPFVFFSVDTLVKEDIHPPEQNWFGVAKVSDTSRFCSAKVENSIVVRIDDKIKCDNEYAFIGLAGIKDYEPFWTSLSLDNSLIKGEKQVSNGFQSLLKKTLLAKNFTWFDTGTPEAHKYALQNYPNGISFGG